VLLVGAVSGQAPAPSVHILAPRDGSYPPDPIVIRAAIDPATTRVERMEFFGEGQLICTVAKAPFECVWNVGPELRKRTIRVVALLADGRRRPRSARLIGCRLFGGCSPGSGAVVVKDGVTRARPPEVGLPGMRR
jgi:hypothetical protein